MGRPSHSGEGAPEMLTVCRMGDEQFGHRRVDAELFDGIPSLSGDMLSRWCPLLPTLTSGWMREPAPTSYPSSAGVHRHTHKKKKLIKIKLTPHQHFSEEKLRENSKIAKWPL